MPTANRQIAELKRKNEDLTRDLMACMVSKKNVEDERDVAQRNLQVANQHADNLREDLKEAREAILKATREWIETVQGHAADLRSARAEVDAGKTTIQGLARSIDVAHDALDALPVPPPRSRDLPDQEEARLSLAQRVLVLATR